MLRDISHPLVGQIVRLTARPLSGFEGTVAWFEPPDRLAIDLGDKVIAIVHVSDIKLIRIDSPMAPKSSI